MAVAWRIKAIVSRALRFGETRLQAHRHERDVATGEQVGEALLGRAGRLARVEHDFGDEFVVFEAGRAFQAVADRERADFGGETGHRGLASLFAE